MRLLMVCLGNICRSPLAEGALRVHLQRAGLAHRVIVDSAGTGGWHAGEPPDHRSIAVAARAGVDLRDQRARQLKAQDFEDFDWLLCADRSVLRDVRGLATAGRAGRVALLLDWAGVAANAEVPDPYTGDMEAFERTWQLVDAAAVAIVRRLAAGGVASPLGVSD